MSDAGNALPPLIARVQLDVAALTAEMDAVKAQFEEMATAASASFKAMGLTVDGVMEETGVSAKQAAAVVTQSMKAASSEQTAAFKAGLAEQSAALRVATAQQLSDIKVTESERIASVNRTSESNKTAASSSSGVWKLATAAIIGVSVDMAGKFQQQTNVLVTAAGESASALGKVRQGILDISTSTGTSWQQVTEGMYTLEKAGYRGADALTVMKVAAQGAREEGADLGVVTNGMTSIMSAFNIPASGAVGTMNQLKTAAGETKDTMQNFTGALSAVLPKAQAAHLSFADTAGALAQMTQSGMSSQQAAQNLADAISHLSNPTQQMTNQMAQFGLNSQDVAKNLGKNGLVGTMDMLSQTILQKMGPSGTVLLNTFNQSKIAAQDAQTMFNNLPPAVQHLASAYKDGSLSLGDYRKQLKDLPADQAALAQQWATLENKANGFQQTLRQGGPQAQTYNAALAKMTGDSASLGVALQLTGAHAEEAQGRVNKIADSAKNAGKDVQGWSTTQANFNTKMGEFKQSMERVGITLGTDLMPPLEVVMGIFKDLANDFIKSGSAGKDLALALAGVAGVVLAIEGGAKAYAAAVKIAADAQKLWGVATTVWSGITKAATGVQAAFNIVMDANPIVLVVLGVAALALGMYELYQHVKPVREAFNAIGNFFKTGFIDAIHAVTHAWDSIKTAFDATVKWFKDLPKTIMGALGDAGNWLKKIGSDIITGLWNGIQDAWSLLITFIKNIPNYIIFAIGFEIGLLYRVGSDIITGLWNGIKDIWNGDVKFFTELPGKIENFFTDALHWLEKAGADLLTGLWSEIKTGWNNEVHFWTDLPGKVKDFFTDAINWLEKAGGDILTGLWNAIKQGWSNEVHFWSDLPGKIKNYFGDAVNWLSKAGNDVINGLESGVKSAWSSIVSFFTNVPGTVEGWFKDAGKWLSSAGSDIITGLINGVKDAMGGVGNIASQVAGKFESGFKSALGIKSPSTVMHEAGSFLMQGLANGIIQSQPLVHRAMRSVTGGIMGSVGALNGAMAFNSGAVAGAMGGGAVNSSTVNRNYVVNASVVGTPDQTMAQFRKMEFVYG